MVNPILDAKNECRALVASALAAAVADGSLPEAEAPEFNVEIPGDTSHGDLSTNAAMVSARAFRKAPPDDRRRDYFPHRFRRLQL